MSPAAHHARMFDHKGVQGTRAVLDLKSSWFSILIEIPSRVQFILFLPPIFFTLHVPLFPTFLQGEHFGLYMSGT